MNFSVLMSVYYKENSVYLDQALTSIWDNQTLKPNQIVLVEDGKLTDSLYLIISKWKEKLKDILDIVSLDVNQGTGIAKNIGLNHCKYEFVAIMDSDDISLPTRFSTQIEYLTNFPDTAILGSQMLEFSGSINNIVAERNVPLDEDDIRNYAKYRSPFNHQSLFYNRKIIESAGGYQHHLYMEDYNLFLRVIVKNYLVKNINDVLVCARVDNGMYGRRRGWIYIKSEWQLAKLKVELKIQPFFASFGLFIVRSIPRMLPASFLKKIYFFLRK